MVETIRKNWHLVLYLLLSFLAVSPLLSPGFFPIHDDTQVARVFEMAKSLSHGMFPVRWVEDLGYGAGYPIFNFYSVLPYYMGGFLTVLGLNALDSTKFVFMVAIVTSGVSMFLLVKEFFGRLAGLVASLIYLYFPYHAVNIYVRGDLAEAAAYVFLPLVFLSLFKISQLNKFSRKYIAIGALSIAAVVISHNLSAFMLFIFIGLFCPTSLIVIKKRRILFLSYALILTIGFLLSAFYSLPAIFEMRYTNISSIIGGGAHPLDHFICISQLWNSPWGFGGSTKGCIDGMSFMLGKVNILIAIIALLLFVINFRKIKERLFILVFSFTALIISLFMMLEYSFFVWQLPFMDFLQFPWRFLNFSGLFIAFISGYLIWQAKAYLDKKIIVSIAFVAILLTFIDNASLFNPKTIHDRDSGFYTNKTYLKWTVSKISDEYLPRNFKKPMSWEEIRLSPFDIIKGKGDVTILQDRTQENRVKVNMEEDGTVRANIAYFPAWKAYLDGHESSYIIKEDGLYINLAIGEHTLTTKFVQTPVEILSNFLSIIGLLGVIIVIIPYGKKAS